jgi:hypothetical protein
MPSLSLCHSMLVAASLGANQPAGTLSVGGLEDIGTSISVGPRGRFRDVQATPVRSHSKGSAWRACPHLSFRADPIHSFPGQR